MGRREGSAGDSPVRQVSGSAGQLGISCRPREADGFSSPQTFACLSLPAATRRRRPSSSGTTRSLGRPTRWVLWPVMSETHACRCRRRRGCQQCSGGTLWQRRGGRWRLRTSSLWAPGAALWPCCAAAPPCCSQPSLSSCLWLPSHPEQAAGHRAHQIFAPLACQQLISQLPPTPYLPMAACR